MNILIRNLSRQTTEKDLRNLFASFGTISALNIVMDEASGQSKGFGFVEMRDVKEAKKAIHNLNGKKIDGEKIRVKSTKQRMI
ncbi:MAG: RNA-binding protein [Spirochaetales bacterium]|nr:RNA-binding protein [Spirochaetales bacterium]